MNFLADESCDFSVARALRDDGHDVLAVAERMPGAPDTEVIELAVREHRILLTEDKDFGQLVFAAAHTAAAVILIRYPSRPRRTLPAIVVDVVRHYGETLVGGFVVIQPGRVRVQRPNV